MKWFRNIPVYHECCRYAIYVIKDNKVDVEKLGDKDATYDQFLVDLKQMDGDRADCRFAGI